MTEILIILLLILINGLFSMSEMAVVSARKTTLTNQEKEGKKGAKEALQLANNPDRFLSTVQIGITLVGLLTGIYSGAALADSFAQVFVKIGLSYSVAHMVAQTIIVVIVTYLTIVFGELVPKRLGLNLAEKISVTVARPMMCLSKLAAPFVWLLSKTTEFFVKMLGINKAETKVTEDDIKQMVQEGLEDGVVEEVEQDIVERVFLLGDLKVSQLMTHRTEMEVLYLDMTKEEVKNTVLSSVYETYLVVEDSLDNAVGVAQLKDLVGAFDAEEFNLKNWVQPADFIYENMSVYKALEQMKENRISMSFICDEFGTFQGVITLKDILEGLVGTIQEEESEPDIVQREDGKSWLVDGQGKFYEFLTYFEREDLYPHTQKFNTIAGFLIEQMKKVPHVGETLKWGGFYFEIIDMDGARIDKVLVTLNDKEA
jgi:putative hemolysin